MGCHVNGGPSLSFVGIREHQNDCRASSRRKCRQPRPPPPSHLTLPPLEKASGPPVPNDPIIKAERNRAQSRRLVRGGGGGDGDEGDDDDYFDEGDDEEGDDGFMAVRSTVPETYNREAIQAVMAEWYKTLADLPAGLRMAIEMGMVSCSQLVRFMSVDVRPSMVRAVSRSMFERSRKIGRAHV